MPLNGDFVKLKRVIHQAHQLAGKRWRRGVTKQMSEETVELVRGTFQRSTAPDGAKWAPLRKRRGRPLLDTGRLRNSVLRHSDADGYKVFTNVVYAALQNFGGTVSQGAREQVSFHNRRGRFISEKKTKRLKKWSSSLAKIGARSFGVPARPFFPPQGSLPSGWARRLRRVASTYVSLVARGQVAP